MSQREKKLRHWIEVIGDEVIREKREPYVIASGITLSGPVHLGTCVEFLYNSAIEGYIREHGYKTRFLFIADDMDAFDNIPSVLEQFEFLKDELGKPLCKVTDPFGCCKSYGEHYLNQARDIMEKFEVYPEIYRAHELYSEGRYDKYAKTFIERLPEVIDILEEVSMRKLPEGWKNILLPICEGCGRIATTRVRDFEGGKLSYSCDVNVGYTKGCGYEGEMSIEDHRYKLMWRLDWPSRQDFFNVAAEGAGPDHWTKGGSWFTTVAIHRRIFNKEPPVGFKYGFLLFKGKKYSKSKALGIGVQELLDLVPPELLKFFLFKLDVEENKEFDPTGYNLIKLYDEFSYAEKLLKKPDLTRAEHKLLLSYKLVKKKKWMAEFLDILMNYQILRDWKAVGERVGDPEGVMYLKPYIENWISYGYVPEEYQFEPKLSKVEGYEEAIVEFAEKLDSKMSALDVHNLVYQVANNRGIDPKALFKHLYLSLIGKSYGPRFGRLIVALGIEKVKEGLLELYKSKNDLTSMKG